MNSEEKLNRLIAILNEYVNYLKLYSEVEVNVFTKTILLCATYKLDEFGRTITDNVYEDKIKPAEKIVILGSIKSDREKSRFIKVGEITRIPKYLPENIFTEKSALAYSFIRRFFDPKNPKLMEYFTVRDPYYLKWSIEKIAEWKFKENPKVIQILADKDIVFPIKYSKPNYVIQNGTHLFPATKHREVSELLSTIFV